MPIVFGEAVETPNVEFLSDPDDGPPVIEFEKYWLVVDPDTKEVIGKIFYPHKFCPGMSCPTTTNKKHPYSYRNQGLTCVHMHCGKPTESYASVTYRDQIQFEENYSLPWEENTPPPASKE